MLAVRVRSTPSPYIRKMFTSLFALRDLGSLGKVRIVTKNKGQRLTGKPAGKPFLPKEKTRS